MTAPDLRIAVDLSWWERLIERLGWWGERWEYRASDGWRRFWRKDGYVPIN